MIQPPASIIETSEVIEGVGIVEIVSELAFFRGSKAWQINLHNFPQSVDGALGVTVHKFWFMSNWTMYSDQGQYNQETIVYTPLAGQRPGTFYLVTYDGGRIVLYDKKAAEHHDQLFDNSNIIDVAVPYDPDRPSQRIRLKRIRKRRR